MDGTYSLLPWYGDNKMVAAVNRCMDAIERTGLSAGQAENVPKCLAEAIQKSNQLALSNTQFRAAHFRVEIKDGGYEVTVEQ